MQIVTFLTTVISEISGVKTWLKKCVLLKYKLNKVLTTKTSYDVNKIGFFTGGGDSPNLP